jgi:superfamily I DNA/RNA helicase
VPGNLATAVAEAAGDEHARMPDGKVAVLVPPTLLAAVRESVAGAIPEAALTGGPAALDAPVAVLSVAQAKGLEFDSVLVVEPAALLADSPRGLNDLYVALTRTTGRLGLVHAQPLPAVLDTSPSAG